MERWCGARGKPRGAVVTMQQGQELACVWFGDRLDATWQPVNPSGMQDVFNRLGLTGPFWRLE